MISVHFKGKPFNITAIQVYAPTSNAEEAEVEQFCEDLQPSRTNTLKRHPFHYRGLECKSRTSRDTWSKIGKFGLGVQNEAGQRLMEFCQENTLVIANTFFQQHKRRLYTWTILDGQYKIRLILILKPKMEKLYTVSKKKTGS